MLTLHRLSQMLNIYRYVYSVSFFLTFSSVHALENLNLHVMLPSESNLSNFMTQIGHFPLNTSQMESEKKDGGQKLLFLCISEEVNNPLIYKWEFICVMIYTQLINKTANKGK